MYREVHLHGALKEKYGGPFRFDISTPAEAVSALSANFKGFAGDIRDGEFFIYRGDIEKEQHISEAGLTISLGRAKQLHIVPALAGAGRGKGGAKAVIGAILIVAAIVTMQPELAALSAAGETLAGVGAGASAGFGGAAFSIGGLTVTYGNIAMFGLSMMVSGIASMLAPQPKAQNFEPVDRKQSYMFTGAINTTTQGNAVPLVYGRIRTGSVVVSAGIEAIEIT